jgi:putative DNA primase/helicase
VLDALTRGGYDPRPSGPGKWESRCPVHKGDRRNLSVDEGQDGTALVHCHHVDDAGRNCPVPAIVAALGLTVKDLFPAGFGPGRRPKNGPGRKARGAGFGSPREAADWLAKKIGVAPTAHWVYRVAGVAVAVVYRFDRPGDKEYRPVSRDESGGWRVKDPAGNWPLYQLDDLDGASTVWILEGEKCVELARGIGVAATTTAHGAKSPHKTDLSPLAGKDVVIVPDAGAPGEGYASALLGLLAKLDPAPSVRVLDLPGLTEDGDDVEQWLASLPDSWDAAQRRAELERLLAESGRVGPATSANGHTPHPAVAAAEEESDPIHRTDLGNARRLIDRFGKGLRYCPKWGAWLIWDGRRWREDETGEIHRLAKRTVRHIGAEAADVDDDAEAKAVLKWALESESKKRLDAMVGLAWSEPGIPVEVDELNADPWALNVENGTVDLRTGELRPHRQADLITRLAPVTFDPKADCPKWLAFLERVLGGDKDLIAFVRRAAGYAATGDVSEHALLFLYGTGRNGKGTFLETLLALLGEYATTIDAGHITARRYEDHPTWLTDLDGRRFVATVEVEDGKQMAEALVKKLTGGDRVKARRMREDNYEFDPSHKIFLAANHPPEIRGTDEGIWSRIKLIPFNVFIPPEERIRDLRKTMVREEGPGILNWIVAGCLEWRREGLKEPQAVTAATKNYRTAMDAVGGFLTERCDSYLDNDELKEKARTPKDKLYHAYVDWAKSNGCDPVLSGRKFGSELERRGYTLKTSNGRYYRLGLSLKAVTEAGDADDSNDGGTETDDPIPF